MRNINTYIIEKFKISKDIQLSAEEKNNLTISKTKDLVNKYLKDNFKSCDIVSTKINKGMIYFQIFDNDEYLDNEDCLKIVKELGKILKDEKIINDIYYDIGYLPKTSTIKIHPNWAISRADFDKKVFRH